MGARAIIVTLGAILGAATPAWAGAPGGDEAARAKRIRALPEAIDLAGLLRLVRESTPWAAAWQAETKVAAAERVAAGRYPNPELAYGGEALVGGANLGSSRLHQLTVSQPLMTGGQWSARHRAADARVAAAEATVERELAALAREARVGFVEVLAAEARRAATVEARARVVSLGAVVASRAEAGHASRYDVERMRLEEERLEVEGARAQAAAVEAARGLGELLALPGWAPVAVGELALREPGAGAGSEARPAPPAVRAAEAEALAASADASVARSERWPDLVVTLGTTLTENEYSGNLVFGLGIAVPLFDFGEGEVARSEATAGARRLAVGATRDAADAAVIRAQASVAARREALGRFDSGIGARLGELAAMAQAAYEGGQASVLDLLDAAHRELDAKLTRVDLLVDVMRAEIDALAAEGRIWEP